MRVGIPVWGQMCSKFGLRLTIWNGAAAIARSQTKSHDANRISNKTEAPPAFAGPVIALPRT